MDSRNGDCFDHDTLFGHMPAESSIEHDCLKDYLLEPSAHDKIGCDGICYPTTKTTFASSLETYGSCNNGNMINLPVRNTMHATSYLDVHNTMNSYLPDYNNVPNSCPLPMPGNHGAMGHFNNNNHPSCGDYPMLDTNLTTTSVYNHAPNTALNLPSTLAEGKTLIQQPIMHETSTLVNRTLSSADTLLMAPNAATSFANKNLPDAILSQSDAAYEMMANNSNFLASPLFSSAESILPCKDSDPFSPSISSSVSSIPSVEMPDKSSYVPGSVDSGVVVNGSSSSPFSTTDSNRNGECSSINDSLISPLTQGTGSERSVETTPGSESVGSEMCSPRVDFEMLSLELNAKNNVKLKEKEKSHKGRKRKNEAKKEKQTKPKKHPVIVPTYQSQISPGQNGIKLKISLANPGPIPVTKKRRKNKKQVPPESEPAEQSDWGAKIPENLLRDIFHMVTESEGCLPFLVRVSQVCRLWKDVALTPDLWYNIDLSNRWVSKNPIINDYNLSWLLEHRLSKVQDLNLGGWTFLNVPAVLEKIAKCCTELSGIGLAGWENLTADNVKYLVSNCPNLQRINLSGVSSNQSSNNKSGVALSSLLFIAEEVGERLTQLVLSDNKLVGIPQFIQTLATHCPNLEVLDLSNVRTLTATGHIHVEKLQEGCQKLRILRITNSQVSLTPLSLKEQMASPGFPHLEELSVACMMNSLSSLTQPFVDDESIERILKTSTKLKLLDARNCSKVTDSSLVRVPAWDLTHLYLSGSYVTRVNDSGLELIAQKWSHSLIEVDFAWSTVTKSLDAAVTSLAEQGESSRLKILDLTGSSINLPPVQAVLKKCPLLVSLNLSSCRALPRGMKRLYAGKTLEELKASLNKPLDGACKKDTLKDPTDAGSSNTK